MKTIYSNIALQDLDTIWDAAAERWGTEQAQNYLLKLDAGIKSLVGKPYLWIPYNPSTYSGLMLVRVEHHYYFFKACDAHRIAVVAIFHEKMDFSTRLQRIFESLNPGNII